MKRPDIFIKIFLLTLLLSLTAYAQFDSLIFKKEILLEEEIIGQNISALGDQNSDGYDDFMLYDSTHLRMEIYFGGNPVDTIPEFSINGDFISASILDLNNDLINDIVLITNDFSGPMVKKIQIHYGGSIIDTIPDISFYPPPGSNEHNFGWFTTVLKDFNGDGRSELIIFNPELPYSNKQFGTLYFYNTGSEFDTIPAITVCGDSVDSVRIFQVSSSGDINGDGLTDFTIYGYKGYYNIPANYFRRYYLGNQQWELSPDAEYYQGELPFDPEYMQILKDINKDGKDDILIPAYGDYYPYWFHDAILKGSFPIDTIPDWGLNTQNIGLWVLRAISLGDVNGDSFNDFMAPTITPGTPGLKLWVGGRNYPEDNTANKNWYGGEEGFCRDYAAVGDVNGDGVDDIAIAQIPLVGWPWLKPYVYIFSGDTTVKADTVLSVKEKDYNPQGYKLFDPYPNPFNPSTVIEYQVPERSHITLSVYDILGRETNVLVDGDKNEGRYRIDFNGGNLASGIYFYRIEAKSKVSGKQYTKAGKMILLK